MFKGVFGMNNDVGFSGDKGPAGDDRGDFAGVGKGFEGSFKDAADDGGLSPDLTFGELFRGCEAGEFCAGAGAAGRTVVGRTGAEDEILRVGLYSGLGGSEALDVVNFSAVFSGDILSVQGVANGLGEFGESGNVLRFDFRTLIGDEEKPIASPGDVAVDRAVAGDIDRDVFSEAIGRNVFDGHRVVIGEESGDDSNGSFDPVLAGFNAALMGEGFHDADGAVKAGVEAGEVVEENDSCDTGGVLGLAETSANDGVEAPGFIDEGGANPVGFILDEVTGGDGSDRKFETGDDGSGGFAAGVGIDDAHFLEKEVGWEARDLAVGFWRLAVGFFSRAGGSS